MFYRQCTLWKGNRETTSWIPERFAAVGRVLRLRRNGRWSDGWRVAAVYGRRGEDSLPDAHRAIKSHRRQTGDAEPKPTA